MSHKLMYSKSEIYRMYKNAKHPGKQIVILAQLNCVTTTEIKQIIQEMEQSNSSACEEANNMITTTWGDANTVEREERSVIDDEAIVVSTQSLRYNKADIQKCIREGLSARQAAEKLGYSYSTKRERNNFSTRYYTIRRGMKLTDNVDNAESAVEEASITSDARQGIDTSTEIHKVPDQSIECKLDLVIKEMSEIQSSISALKATISKYEELVNKLISAFQQ